MMRRMHERRGSTKADMAGRGDRDPAGSACLTLPELERILALEIDSYNHTVHHGTGERPMDRYSAYFGHADLPDAERLPSLLPAESFLLDFLPWDRRHLVRTGMRLFRVDYSSRDLLPMWRERESAQGRANRCLQSAQPGDDLDRGRRRRRLHCCPLPRAPVGHDAGGERGGKARAAEREGRRSDRGAAF